LKKLNLNAKKEKLIIALKVLIEKIKL